MTTKRAFVSTYNIDTDHISYSDKESCQIDLSLKLLVNLTQLEAIAYDNFPNFPTVSLKPNGWDCSQRICEIDAQTVERGGGRGRQSGGSRVRPQEAGR